MESLIIPVVALLIPIVIVPTALGFKHARFLREVEHTERMKALEVGRSLAEDEEWSPRSVGLALGAGVPLAALLIALFAAMNRVDAAAPVAAASGVIGLGGVLCGTFLASREFAARPPVAAPLKPEPHPEAHDFAGYRG